MIKIANWYDRWRHALAWLYISLVFLDYGVRPILNYANRKENNPVEILLKLKDYDPAIQLNAIQITTKNNGIEPILNEFVHVAFGAILTGASITRGLERTAMAKQNLDNDFNRYKFNDRNTNLNKNIERPGLDLQTIDAKSGTIEEQ